jgi:rhamnosyltransferase
MLIRRQEFERLGGFDTAFHNGYEDVDLCLRLGQQGGLVRYCPRSVLYHLESVTRWPTGAPVGTEISDRVYAQRWRSRVERDDVHHYLEDGLLRLAYGPHYPVTMTISPELAVVERDGEGLRGMDWILNERSKQVMDLIVARTRSELSAAKPPLPESPASSRGAARLISTGREHHLGEGPASHLVSIVIPVKNSARYLRDLLPAVLAQSVSARVEIVAVDSGSSDETIAVLRDFGATVLEIDEGDFDHGLTRNLAAENAHGDILVFVSHRSQPVGDRWLAPLIAALADDPELAGVCSRVSPRAEADLLTRRDVERDLSASAERRRIQISDWSAYRGMSPEERRRFLNFHTVSAAIRAEAWKTRPFRPVRTLGEDLLWARETLEAGWALLHEPASVVRHSHNYTLEQILERNVDDGIANRDIVGRTFNREQVIPMIRALVQADWSFLTDTAGLRGEELEQWQLESALRRGAQVLGQWIGMNYETLPEAMVSELSSIARLKASRSGLS